MYGSFIKKNTGGYTKAQSSSLRRSAEIKKSRKEEERAFERAQERERGRRALTERKMMEAGSTERERMSNIGQMARQRLAGEQQRGAATTAATTAATAATTSAIRGADVESMKYGRQLTRDELEHKRSMELAKVERKGGLDALFDSPGEGARASLGKEEEVPKSVLTDFLDMGDSQKRKYMDRLRKEDPDTYLSLAKQFKMWSEPEPEKEVYTGGRPIRQSDSGTYTNF
jgi:hypothetical protein